ncbi:hypothetical protein ACOZ4L_11915 [Haloplanus ruber]|uniref:Uncharacterized protein n=1 Tax=Haloplanus ruber TaxID=869892 RepID=A0ABD6CV36_9EURY|nr:hypothetical protein [Haloplanus ruber]
MHAVYVAYTLDASDSDVASDPVGGRNARRGGRAPSRPPRALCSGQSGSRR